MTNGPGSVARALAGAGLEPAAGVAPLRLGGGDISPCWRVATRDGTVFVKTGTDAEGDMLEAEAEGLAELAAPGALRVPRVLGCGRHDGGSFLALEWIDFDARDASADALLGARLAALHRCVAGRHGWHRPNRIGATPQPNPWTDDWCEFWATQRLRHQLDLAARHGYRGDLARLGNELVGRLPTLLAGHAPAPSLLHGDLWAGNRGACGGEPVIYDPAVYYGDRETDLAMTRLFGGFSAAFYAAYERAWPLPPGHERRLPLYQLYHVLNHLNLFGGAYLGRAVALTRGVLGAG